MTDKIIVFTTAGSEEEAGILARALVERRLAACVTIVPQVESVYRWNDAVESAREWLLVIKTTAASFPALREAILQLHSYEVPECIAVPIEDGSAGYLAWLESAVSSEKSSSP